MSASRIGLCLCGGGITGAMYEVGCLAALEESFEGFLSSKFDLFVGASSGAVVALALAGGYSATRMYRALLDPADDFFPLQRHHLIRFDTMEIKRVVTSVLGAARRVVTSATSRPLDIDLWEEVQRFTDSMPAGLFATDPFERFLGEFMTRRGIPRTFRELPSLLVVANDLDRGERVVFGRGHQEDVLVARAVAAANAVPVLYAPVRIDDVDYVAGGLGETGHVDLAAEAGCDTVITVNAMVPIRTDPASRKVPTGHGPMKRVRDKGLLWVYNQAWRVVAQARMHKGIELFRARHPDVDVLLIEPDSTDATMFMYSPMNFAARRVILEHGYHTTARLLRDESSPIRAALERRGLELRP
jgi:predicted acylesterase/phospholipase RssA